MKCAHHTHGVFVIWHCGSANHHNKSVVGTPQCQILATPHFYSVAAGLAYANLVIVSYSRSNYS